MKFSDLKSAGPRKKLLFIIAVVVLVAVILVLAIGKPWQTSEADASGSEVDWSFLDQKDAYQQQLEERGYTPITVGFVHSTTHPDRVNLQVNLKDDGLTLEDYATIHSCAESIFLSEEIQTVNVSLSYGDGWDFTYQDWENGLTPEEVKAPQEAEAKKKAAQEAAEKEKEAQKAREQAEEKAKNQETATASGTKIWNRSESTVISSLRSSLSAQTLYNHEFSMESYETGEGTLYSVTMDGNGTGTGYMWMTDTENGGKRPCVVCSDLYDSVNGIAFSMASIALVKECGGYSFSTAEDKFSQLYGSDPTGSHSIDTTIDGTRYILAINDGVTVLSVQRP